MANQPFYNFRKSFKESNKRKITTCEKKRLKKRYLKRLNNKKESNGLNINIPKNHSGSIVININNHYATGVDNTGNNVALPSSCLTDVNANDFSPLPVIFENQEDQKNNLLFDDLALLSDPLFEDQKDCLSTSIVDSEEAVEEEKPVSIESNFEYINKLQGSDTDVKKRKDILRFTVYIEVSLNNRDLIDTRYKASYLKSCQGLVCIQRSTVQVYAMRYLESSYHWTLGKKGTKQFFNNLEDYQSILHYKCNEIDHLPTNDSKFSPLVINTNKLKIGDKSYLSVIDRHWCKFLGSDLFNEFMSLSKRTSTISLHLGYTTLEANAWSKSCCEIKPGFTSVLDKMSHTLKKWAGKLLILLTEQLINVCPQKVFFNDGDFQRKNKVRKLMNYEFGKKLMLKDNQSKGVLLPGLSIILSTDVRYHRDKLNNNSSDDNITIVSSKLIDRLVFRKDISDQFTEALGKGQYLYVTAVAYSRSVVGTYCVKQEQSKKEENIFYRSIIPYLNDSSYHFEYQSFVKNKSLLTKYIKDKNNQAASTVWRGIVVSRPACSDRMLYYSSFVSQIIHLLLKQDLQYKYMVELWAIVVVETNGQQTFFVILDKWIKNEYLQGKSFSDSLLEFKSLFYMYDRECIELNKSSKSWPHCSKFQRYQMSNPLTCSQRKDIDRTNMLIQKLHDTVIIPLKHAFVSEENILEVHNNLKQIKGIGTVKSLVAIQLSGVLQLTNPVVALWSTIEKGGTGSYQFFSKLSGKENFSQEDAVANFSQLLSSIRNLNNSNLESCVLENICCELGRKKRKKDLIFLYENHSLAQSFFEIKRLSKKTALVRMLFNGQFRKLPELVEPMFIKNYEQDCLLDKREVYKPWCSSYLKTLEL